MARWNIHAHQTGGGGRETGRLIHRDVTAEMPQRTHVQLREREYLNKIAYLMHANDMALTP
jgi:hypothetical protein